MKMVPTETVFILKRFHHPPAQLQAGLTIIFFFSSFIESFLIEIKHKFFFMN